MTLPPSATGTPDDLRQGAWDARIFLGPAGLFGLLFGTATVSDGWPAWIGVAMSGFAFAGSAQFPALGLWAEPIPLLAICITAFFAASRHILMGLSLAEQFRPYSWPKRLMAFAFLTDVNWVLLQQDRGQRNLIAYLIGSGLTMYVPWVVGTVIGAVLPSLLDPVTVVALGFAGIIFITLLTAIVARTLTVPKSPMLVAAGASVLLTPSVGVSAGIVLSVGIAAVAAAVVDLRQDPQT